MGGAFHLFTFSGINVSIHFSWFIIAAYQLLARPHGYLNPVWAGYEYLMLFGIVLLHEFGHALACRQTGGVADRIMLWPLGGVAFVRPPLRPTAQLWSIAAGPLVNLVLVPILYAVYFAAGAGGWWFKNPDAYRLVVNTNIINAGLLVFNLLPIYPLDGGQILRSLLWFPLGRIRSLKIAAAIGFVGSAGVGLLAWNQQSIWIGVMAFFLVSQAMAGWRQAQELALAESEAEAARQPTEPPRPPMI
jgi:Zn-dependent protease